MDLKSSWYFLLIRKRDEDGDNTFFIEKEWRG